MKIRQVGEGAYFVLSYSEQTIMSYQPSITNQTIISEELPESDYQGIEVEEDVFTREDFEQALK